MPQPKRAILLATALAGLAVAHPAFAQESGRQIDAIQSQITQLQQELKRIRSDLAARDRQMKSAQADAAQARRSAQMAASQAAASATLVRQTPPSAPPAMLAAASPVQTPPLPLGTFHLGGVTVTLGGFLAAEGVYRTRNNVADIGSNFNAIPLGQNPNAHTGEFRGSARQTRISLLASGQISPDEQVTGYYESDFLGVGTTSNSNESNSYVPRLRQAYLTYDNTKLGVHVLAGQAWSLLTLNRVGITPHQEVTPLTIDASYVPGFTWKRQWQLRVDKDMFNHTLWLGASLEEPQSTYYTGPNGLGVLTGTATIATAGGSQLNATTTYSDDVAPDMIVKAAYDPGWGHYEVFGLGRFLHDRVSVVGGGHNNTVMAGGVGGGMILPLIPNYLDFQLSGLAGYGIGTYGSGQLPDAITTSSGAPRALAEYQIMGGLVAHPTSALDLYGYGGSEQISRASFNEAGKAYGYGNPLYANGGCSTELSAATCVGNTSGITQGTVGGWWRLLHAAYGTVEVGAQYSYTKRSIFSGIGLTSGATTTPSTDDNMLLFSVRYLPFQ